LKYCLECGKEFKPRRECTEVCCDCRKINLKESISKKKISAVRTLKYQNNKKPFELARWHK